MVDSAYQVFVDLDATALEGGYVYLGQVYGDPEISPIATFWDEALTIPAAQPLRTSGGYIVRNGSPANVFAASTSYSVRVRARDGALVYYVAASGPGLNAGRATFPLASGPKGGKGDPGGNVESIGGFVELAAPVTLPGGTDTVVTSGYHVPGVGAARYAYDASLTPAFLEQFPRSGFRATGDRVFRLVGSTLELDAFGARGDCTSVGQGTDDWAAFDEARRYLSRIDTGTLLLGARAYRNSQRHVFTKGITIIGQGVHENPGIVGGQMFNGVTAQEGSLLVFDAGTGGLLFRTHTGDVTAAERDPNIAGNWLFSGARKSRLMDFGLYGGFAGPRTAHGVETRTQLHVENVASDAFPGDGWRIEAAGHTENVMYGNADYSTFNAARARFNLGHGFRTLGNDANVIKFTACDSAVNGGVGFLEGGQLGNGYDSCHSATNNQSHPGSTAPAYAAHRATLLAECPQLSDLYAGSFATSSDVGASTFTGCYIEGGIGFKAHLLTPAVVTGGNLASRASWTSTSTATVVGYQTVENLTSIKALLGNPLTLETTEAKVTRPDGMVVTQTIAFDAATVFRLYSGGTVANGLDITVAAGVSYSSAGEHVFRNATQSVTFGTFNSGGLNLAAGLALKIGGTQVVGPRLVKPGVPTLDDVVAALEAHGLWA